MNVYKHIMILMLPFRL